MAGAGALFLGLSRNDELDADAFAVRCAAAVGYDPSGLRRFVARLEEREGEESVSLLEKTHPDADDRGEALDEALADRPADAAPGVTAAGRFAGRAGGMPSVP